ncbi:uncharacterized protein L3040_004434 [Drepanopeziza brunnea f. sp. 'multigermtubi']|uniref:uncharacterized protein n=1 Tax=Drepanopeziza brunnea f. sp. 'multigermtubi' TaxID=698441 RepID=UPI0023A0A4E8|nr:hypothetical protein L3040_004434 [Drepanopeziza brunnea f. sp. 'multigermtubi']
MRIACLQFAPQVGDIDNNLNRADSVLNRANPQNLDLLVLPELAFTGYNFRSLHHISPYLEPMTSGITSLWARTTALKYNCVVTAGYPEKVDLSPKWPASPEYYNSAITVNADGETIANYRKSFLFYTDETWALEGPDGFYDGNIEGLGDVAMGICMDLNPYKFEAAWNAWEFAHHVLHRQSNLIILSMAWMTRENGRSFCRTPKEPDMDTLSYWLARLEPIIRNEGEEEIIAVFANRTGTEENAVYAGSSAVLGIQAGEVKVYGILGRGDRELLVVDTSERPKLQLVSEPRDATPPAPTIERGIAPSAALDAIAFAAATANKISETRLSTSSDSANDSDQSLSSQQSISTSHTSIDLPQLTTQMTISTTKSSLVTPQLDSCSFSPISPVGNPTTQAYFPEKTTTEPCPHEPKQVKERKLTPVPQSTEHGKFVERHPTPIPIPSVYSRPASPKSRNCSRSRGAALQVLPPIDGSISRMGSILSDEQRLQESLALGSMSMIGQGIDFESFIEERLDPNEIIYIEGEDDQHFESVVGNILEDAREDRADFMGEYISNQHPPTKYSPCSVSQVESNNRRTSSQSAMSLSRASQHSINVTSSREIFLVDHSRSRDTSRGRAPLRPRVSSSSRVDIGTGDESQLLMSAICAHILESPTFQSVCNVTQSIGTVNSGDSQHRSQTDTAKASEKSLPLLPTKVPHFDSLFTRNPLGPRSRHITPRPLSTVW